MRPVIDVNGFSWNMPRCCNRQPRTPRHWRKIWRHCIRRATAWLLLGLEAESVDPALKAAENFAMTASENWGKVAMNAVHMHEVARTGKCNCAAESVAARTTASPFLH